MTTQQCTVTKINPGDDMHLTCLMAPYSLNLVTGDDRRHLLAFGRAAFDAGRAAGVEAEPVAWRVRYRSPPEMLGHYPWTYTERKPRLPNDTTRESEPVYTITEYAPVERQPLSFGKLDELAKVYGIDYASPHHITFTVGGLRSLIEAASGISRP